MIPYISLPNGLLVTVAVLKGISWLAGPVATVWLAILGQWWAIWLYVISVFSYFPLGIAMLLVLPLSAPALAVGKRRPGLALVLQIPALLYTNTFITVWCMGVFTFLMDRATSESWFPLMLLAFSIGASPWMYLASHDVREGVGEGSLVATAFMQLAFLVVMAYVLVARPDEMAPLWWIFGGIMLLEVVVAVTLVPSLVGQSAGWKHP